MIRMTYWNKNGIFISHKEYQAFAKQASRKGITTTEHLESLGYRKEFQPVNKTGRPKDSERRRIIEENKRISIVVENGKLVSK